MCRTRFLPLAPGEDTQEQPPLDERETLRDGTLGPDAFFRLPNGEGVSVRIPGPGGWFMGSPFVVRDPTRRTDEDEDDRREFSGMYS
jgi:hypothetical protein